MFSCRDWGLICSCRDCGLYCSCRESNLLFFGVEPVDMDEYGRTTGSTRPGDVLQLLVTSMILFLRVPDIAVDGLFIFLRLPAVEGRYKTSYLGLGLGAGRAYFPRTSRSQSAESNRL